MVQIEKSTTKFDSILWKCILFWTQSFAKFIFGEFTYFLAKQHAEHVANIANIPITPDKITSHVPVDAITLAAVTLFFTEHESIVLIEYFTNKSTSDCFISSESIIDCISYGDNTDP